MNRLLFLSICTAAIFCHPATAAAQASVSQADPRPVTSTSDVDAQPSAPASLEAIVVTATRQQKNLIDVPATVSVLTAETIEQTGAKVATDFVGLTSGISIVTGNPEPTDTSIEIRGLTRNRDAENNVALVVDGILKTNSAALDEPQGALSQVEILKGPQGAIYGRNGEAGAIVITTRKPTSEFHADLKGHAENDRTFGGSAVITGPVSDRVGFVVSAAFDRSDGFYRNTFLGTPLARSLYPNYAGANDAKSIDNYQRWDVFGRLLIRPSDRTQIDWKAHYGYNDSGALNFNAEFQIPSLVTAFNNPIFNLNANDQKYVFASGIASHSYTEVGDTSLRYAHDFDAVKLSSYVAFSHIHNEFYGSAAASGTFFAGDPLCQSTLAAVAPPNVAEPEPFNSYFGLFGLSQPYSPSTCNGIEFESRTQNDVVSEVRLVRDTGPLTWQAGLSFIYIDRFVCVTDQLNAGFGAARTCYTADPLHHTETMQADLYHTNVYAPFGSAEYAVTDDLKVGAALRYDVEVHHAWNTVPADARTLYVGNPLTGHPYGTSTSPANYYLNPGLDPAYNPSGVLAPRKQTFTQLEPKLTVDYKATPNWALFADWGIGFRAGGFNGEGTEAVINGFFNPPVAAGGINAGLKISDNFKKETASAFEIGTKGRFGRNVDFELEGYYTRVHDMQFFEFFVGPFGVLRAISNIDEVNIQGVEGSLNWRVASGISLFGNANYTGSKIEKNEARPYTVGNKSPGTPLFTADGGVQVIRPITDHYTFNFRTDVRVVGPTPFSTVQNNTVPTIFGLQANYKNAIRATYDTVNVRMGISKDWWSIDAIASNVFNKQYAEEVVVAPEFGGSFVAPSDLRRYGIELGMTF